MIERDGITYAIRKLTPLECWRLMGWDDESFHKAEAVNSNTQLYKQAGNGIVTNCVEAIARNLYPGKPTVHLIELFGGIGCQRMGFVQAGIPVVSHVYGDFDKYAVKSYNAVWNESYEPTDITKLHGADLKIDADHEFCLFYSFPCVDLSVAGQQKGMSKGSGTRSGLIWEVERLLNETDILPHVLIMENVPQVHGKKNLADWESWLWFLRTKGYQNFWKDLNARDYGVAQNRNRTFCVSILGDPYSTEFNFPDPIPLTTYMADYLDEEVDEKYYVNTPRADALLQELLDSGKLQEEISKTVRIGGRTSLDGEHTWDCIGTETR